MSPISVSKSTISTIRVPRPIMKIEKAWSISHKDLGMRSLFLYTFCILRDQILSSIKERQGIQGASLNRDSIWLQAFIEGQKELIENNQPDPSRPSWGANSRTTREREDIIHASFAIWRNFTDASLEACVYCYDPEMYFGPWQDPLNERNLTPSGIAMVDMETQCAFGANGLLIDSALEGVKAKYLASKVYRFDLNFRAERKTFNPPIQLAQVDFWLILAPQVLYTTFKMRLVPVSSEHVPTETNHQWETTISTIRQSVDPESTEDENCWASTYLSEKFEFERVLEKESNEQSESHPEWHTAKEKAFGPLPHWALDLRSHVQILEKQLNRLGAEVKANQIRNKIIELRGKDDSDAGRERELEPFTGLTSAVQYHDIEDFQNQRKYRSSGNDAIHGPQLASDVDLARRVPHWQEAVRAAYGNFEFSELLLIAYPEDSNSGAPRHTWIELQDITQNIVISLVNSIYRLQSQCTNPLAQQKVALRQHGHWPYKYHEVFNSVNQRNLPGWTKLSNSTNIVQAINNARFAVKFVLAELQQELEYRKQIWIAYREDQQLTEAQTTILEKGEAIPSGIDLGKSIYLRQPQLELIAECINLIKIHCLHPRAAQWPGFYVPIDSHWEAVLQAHPQLRRRLPRL